MVNKKEEIISLIKKRLHTVLERILLSVEKVDQYDVRLEWEADELKHILIYLSSLDDTFEVLFKDERPRRIGHFITSWQVACSKLPLEELYMMASFCSPLTVNKRTRFLRDVESLWIVFTEGKYYVEIQLPNQMGYIYVRKSLSSIASITRKRLFATLHNSKLYYTELHERDLLQSYFAQTQTQKGGKNG